MCETSLRRIFIPPFQQLKEFRGHLAIWNCQLTEDTILCIEVGITKPDLLVHRFSDRLQQLLPIHTAFHSCYEVFHKRSVWAKAPFGGGITSGRARRLDILTIRLPPAAASRW